MECDILPYNILREILNKVWRCNNCSDCFYGIENFREHRCFILEQVRPTRELFLASSCEWSSSLRSECVSIIHKA